MDSACARALSHRKTHAREMKFPSVRIFLMIETSSGGRQVAVPGLYNIVPPTEDVALARACDLIVQGDLMAVEEETITTGNSSGGVRAFQ